MMIPGTTPTHIFNLPFEVSLVQSVRVFYAVEGKVILQKNTEDVTLEDSKVVVKLTQDETLKFKGFETVEIQLQVLSPSKDAIVSSMHREGILQFLGSEVLE